MAHGEPLGVIDSKFSDRVKDLVKKARSFADHFRDFNTWRAWHTPEEVGDLLDVPSLHNPTWDRNAINILYSEKILGGAGKKGGTCADLIAMKIQADFMAVEERAFRTRHASYVRCASLAHGRLDGHGKPVVNVFDFMTDGIKTTLEAGAKHGATS